LPEGICRALELQTGEAARASGSLGGAEYSARAEESVAEGSARKSRVERPAEAECAREEEAESGEEMCPMRKLRCPITLFGV
jgi:hypothetical protein